MDIRRSTEKEITGVGSFYDRVVRWLDETVNYPKWRYRDYPSEPFVREMTENGSMYICEEDGDILGAFAADTDPRGNYDNGNWVTDAKKGEYLVIHALAVSPDAFGRGIASAAIDHCTKLAAEMGLRSVRVDIVPDNLPAAKLYTANGFIYTGDADMDRGLADIPEFSLFERIV